MKTEFLEEAIIYLNELVEILYQEGYFGFKEDAYEYVDDIFDTVMSDINNMPKKKAPAYFDRYGKDMDYITYRKNNNTTWYIFFNLVNQTYQIRYIGNNHNIGQHL